MQHDRPAFSWSRRLTNCHGAVFLLAVYVTSLLLLIAGGTSMQRAMTETRATQISRDMQQAFYLSDGALEYALAKVKTYYLYDGVCYSAIPTAGRPAVCTPEVKEHGPSFTLETASGQVKTQGKLQVLERRIIATSAVGADAARGTSVVSAYVREEGPLEGIWGNRLVAVYGGGHYDQLPNTYLRGSLRSNRGVLTARLADSQYDPLTTLSGKMVVMNGAVKVREGEDWDDFVDPANDYVSPELLTIKDEYLIQHSGPPGMFGPPLQEFLDPVTYKGVQYPGVEYVDGQHQATFPHVDGGASIGTVQQPINPPNLLQGISQADCNGNLELPLMQTTYVPGNGFEFDGGKVRDLSADPNVILLCVNAIYPQGATGWEDTYYNRPPELVFEKPAIVYVPGSKQVTLADVSPALYEKIGGWDFAIGAKVSSATDVFGKPIPNGLQIAVKRPQSNGQGQPQTDQHSIVWMQPGKFSGSLFAPQSLVVLGERDTADSQDASGNLVPLHLQYLVGDEVIVELAYDELTLGTLDENGKKPKSALTQFLGGWTNHSR